MYLPCLINLSLAISAIHSCSISLCLASTCTYYCPAPTPPCRFPFILQFSSSTVSEYVHVYFSLFLLLLVILREVMGKRYFLLCYLPSGCLCLASTSIILYILWPFSTLCYTTVSSCSLPLSYIVSFWRQFFISSMCYEILSIMSYTENV